MAYGALTGGVRGHIGGVEKQTTMAARWLAARGYKVSLITWDEGQPDGLLVDGVRVLKLCSREAGIPGFRFFHPRWTSLSGAMREADADVYYQNCAEYVTGQVALWCKRNGRRFVYSIASDPDCDHRLPKMDWRERVLYRYGVRNADQCIVQSCKQQAMLVGGFRRNSSVMPLPCSGPSELELLPLADRVRNRVVWVGRVAPVKRLEWLLDMAQLAPDLTFDVVGPPEHAEYASPLLERANSLTNVVVRGAVPRERMGDIYRQACVLCCTSAYEGFPNTFVEAWSWGTPLVSTVDPDHVIARHGLGAVCGNVNGLVASIRSLVESSTTWRRASEAAHRYFWQNHRCEHVMPVFEQLLLGSSNLNWMASNDDL